MFRRGCALMFLMVAAPTGAAIIYINRGHRGASPVTRNMATWELTQVFPTIIVTMFDAKGDTIAIGEGSTLPQAIQAMIWVGS